MHPLHATVTRLNSPQGHLSTPPSLYWFWLSYSAASFPFIPLHPYLPWPYLILTPLHFTSLPLASILTPIYQNPTSCRSIFSSTHFIYNFGPFWFISPLLKLTFLFTQSNMLLNSTSLSVQMASTPLHFHPTSPLLHPYPNPLQEKPSFNISHSHSTSSNPLHANVTSC